MLNVTKKKLLIMLLALSHKENDLTAFWLLLVCTGGCLFFPKETMWTLCLCI